MSTLKNKKLIKINKILMHCIYIYTYIPCEKDKKVEWIIYPTTNPISCLVEHRISDMITYLISSPTKHGI